MESPFPPPGTEEQASFLVFKQAPTSTTDYLSLLDVTTATLITSLLQAQNANPGGGSVKFTITSPGSSKSQTIAIDMPSRTVTMPQLQRAKRQFITLQKQGRQELSPESVADLFAKYLEDILT